MAGINDKSKATIEFCVDWQSKEASHRDFFFAENVNFWRDCFSPDIFSKLQGRVTGEHVKLNGRSNSSIGQYEKQNIHSIKKEKFNSNNLIDRKIFPRLGRFYPQGIIESLPGVFQVNAKPCRCIKVNNSFLEIDLNHPLSIYPVSVSAFIHDIRQGNVERGGRCEDWIEVVTGNGPGMQARYPGLITDFSGEHNFARKDNQPDIKFYSSPRLVHHLDSLARSIVRDIHDIYLKNRESILDLMASWDSHLPETFSSSQLTVLGMNLKELKANPIADDHIVQDINQYPILPFQEKSFDGIICTSSVEYLTKPIEVFNEIARVLKPGGICVMTFSNRWFPPKVVLIWEELYEFERVGLVIDYFLKTQSFEEITTVSYRGRSRPQDDKYYGSVPYSDSVWGVIAKKK
jgi:hypothetical protein